MMAEAPVVDTLGPKDIELLSALLEATEAAQSWIDMKVFRRDQLAHREAIDRLEKAGYVLKERVGEVECYRVSLVAMAKMPEHPLATRILRTAELMWSAFRDHYIRSLDAPITLRAVAESINVPFEQVNRVHAHMREWWRTPISFTPAETVYQSVIVREEVLDYDTFDACIQELRQMYASRMQSNANGFVALAQLGLDGAPIVQHGPSIPAMKEPSWFGKLPQHAQVLMREIHVAQHLGLMALSAMGIRAVIDVTADDILGEVILRFDLKLRRLLDAEHLTQPQFDVINAVVELGHAAAHRSHVPDASDVQLMQEALDHMLCSAYGLSEAKQMLAAKTPPKPNKGQPNKAN